MKRQETLIDVSTIKLFKAILMITLSNDEVALLKAILIALRGIKTQDIDKALVILSKAEKRGRL
ncbi:MAG: hypothetical protein EDM05_62805 [Leptolyngbya sp. IPPAS B-1204]|nr:MAG: hypothetical protein EDM05_26915 [Leptolyngbya sp. IPPAS B-1204]